MVAFTYTVDFSYKAKEKPRVNVLKYGDGYEQRVEDGLNANLRTFDLTFNTRTTAEKDEILDFLRARRAVESFDWTPPDDTAAKFVCRSWDSSQVKAGIWDLSASFEEVAEA